MDSRLETPITATEIDAAYARVYGPAPVHANEQPPQLQPSLMELNSVLLIVIVGVASIFAAAAFLISGH